MLTVVLPTCARSGDGAQRSSSVPPPPQQLRLLTTCGTTSSRRLLLLSSASPPCVAECRVALCLTLLLLLLWVDVVSRPALHEVEGPEATSSAKLKRSASSEPNSTALVLSDSVAATVDDSKTSAAPLSRSTSAVSRLNTFYNWSAVDRKRQRLQNRALADVPPKFHVRSVRGYHRLVRVAPTH